MDPRKLTATDLRDIARACRMAAQKATDDAERCKASSSEPIFRKSAQRFGEFVEMFEQLAKEREG